MIHLDATRETVVITCSGCTWAALELDRADAWKAGLSHQRAAHPEDTPAVEAAARSLFNHRHDHDTPRTVT